jgi:hypothetical protein
MSNKEVTAVITENKIKNECTDVIYPQVAGLKNENVQIKINQLISKQVLDLIPKEGCQVYQTIKGIYKVELNKNGILSIKLDVYTFRKHAANGLDVQKSITVNLETGKIYQIYDLFKRNSNYRAVITRMIKEQIKERDLPLIKEFKVIGDNESFYLTNNALVVYFQEIEFTPHYVGIPEFTIPFSQIKNLINQEGPIARL